MGVVCVISYAVLEGRSGQQTVDLIQKRLEQLGAEKTGTFSVDCETYQSLPPITPQRQVHTLHNTEQPASCFAVLDSGLSLVSDITFDLLMQKLKSFYVERKNIKVESKGQRFTLGAGGDLIVKVGSVILGQGTSFKGVLVEVEYLPCIVPTDCWPLMKEFITGLLGSTNVNLDVPSQHFRMLLDSGLNQGPADCARQYLEHFMNFRKSLGQLQQQQPQQQQQQQTQQQMR